VASISFFLAYGPFNHIVIKGVLKRVCSKKGAVAGFPQGSFPESAELSHR